jgi:hypothetical protein
MLWTGLCAALAVITAADLILHRPRHWRRWGIELGILAFFTAEVVVRITR